MLIQLVSLVLLSITGLSPPVTASRYTSRKGLVTHLPLGAFEQEDSESSNATYAFNLAAFQDGYRALVRIYSEIEPVYVDPIALNELQRPHVNQCHVESINGTEFSVPLLRVDVQWAYGDAERIRTVNKIIAYVVECQDPGKGQFKIAPQLSTGKILGRPVEVEVMELERKGRLAACSQPLFTEMAGLKDWVSYHARLGVNAFTMHVPRGDQIDALFTEQRSARIEETKALNERSPDSVGRDRLSVFNHPLVQWHYYYGAPTANYYSETPLFNACVYRYRYAYDYVMLFDCDEWFTLKRGNSSRSSYKTVPDLLDKLLPDNVASVEMESYAFPAQCAFTDHGDYPSRFTLRKDTIWHGMQKTIVRPLAVACAAIHGIVDLTDQFKNEVRANGTFAAAERALRVPLDLAYIKHIRWFGPPNGTAISCKFGAEAKSWDSVYTLVVQDDSPRRHISEGHQDLVATQ